MVEPTTPPNPADGTGGSKPDPTLLTIDALRREIAMLANLVDEKLDGLAALTTERFTRVDALMDRGEEMRREQKQDTKAAVDAALDSQKEATTKMEKLISDQITSLRSNFDTSIAAIQSNLGDLKDRATAIESTRQGQNEQKTETRAASSGQLAAFGAAMVVVVLIINIVLFLIARTPVP